VVGVKFRVATRTGNRRRWRNDVLLEGKNAVVYGGGGNVGGAVCRAFAREGARVFIAGRTPGPMEEVAADISASGGQAETALLDALDERAVDEHADAIAEKAGGIDISFNAVDYGDVHGTPVLEMPYNDFFDPITTAIRAHFLIARAAARHMAPRGSGVILTITATTARHAIPEVGGTFVRFDATESLCRQLATELGPSGIRVAWLQTTGLPETLQDTGVPVPDYGIGTGGRTLAEHIVWMQNKTMLKRLTSLRDVADVAAFLASDHASAMTATGANLSCGSIPG
jgi:NAD(P)-dependent dehydrogenase (short-subunit alcohol dehydrogenase family)